jgi:hypothetical protein
MAVLSASVFAAPSNIHPPQPKPMAIVAATPRRRSGRAASAALPGARLVLTRNFLAGLERKDASPHEYGAVEVTPGRIIAAGTRWIDDQ